LVEIVLHGLERRRTPTDRTAAQSDRDRGLEASLLPYAGIDTEQEVRWRDIELDRLRVGDHHDVAVVPDVNDIRIVRFHACEQRREILCVRRNFDEVRLLALRFEREVVVRREIPSPDVILDENGGGIRLVAKRLGK
jgi:hypothetical protein